MNLRATVVAIVSMSALVAVGVAAVVADNPYVQGMTSSRGWAASPLGAISMQHGSNGEAGVMSKRAGALVLVAVLAAVMGVAVYGLSSECYPVRAGSDAEECKPRVAHYLGS